MRFAGVRTATAALSCLIAGCSLLGALRHPAAAPAAPVSPGAPQEPLPLANERFELEAAQDVVGVVQVVRATKDDTLTDIARRFNVGYEELLRANPKVDPWLPGEGREIVVPTQFILPDAPRAGLGIGKVGWRTPEGVTKIVRRQKDPTWRVPESVRKEHHDNGEDLDPVIGPGPENPLGKYAFYLQWPSYLIHGTNKPAGVGLRSSHGCIRLYPEDIQQFYDLVPIGTQVRVVNQPFVFGWRDAQLYMQPFDVLEDDTRDWAKAQRKLLSSSLAARLQRELQAQKERVDWSLIASLASNPRGVPVPITDSAATMEQVLAAAPRVRNVLPEGSTWDGKSDLPMDEASFKQMLSETEPAAPGEEGGAAGADAPGAAAKTQPLRPKNGG
ncbi:MAG: LysM peptidoglycan-binding domain-containing protein [Gammaproteobacteria bacterium]|nr:MAG: LysM peptidoglycan-binding domain-containing protein [Gammaproteobacteria bacterium]